MPGITYRLVPPRGWTLHMFAAILETFRSFFASHRRAFFASLAFNWYYSPSFFFPTHGPLFMANSYLNWGKHIRSLKSQKSTLTLGLFMYIYFSLIVRHSHLCWLIWRESAILATAGKYRYEVDLLWILYLKSDPETHNPPKTINEFLK